MRTTESRSESKRPARRLRALAGAVTLAAILAACQNPLAVQLEERIQQDVAITESGGAPAVVSFSPPEDATSVRLDTTVTARFSQPMNSDTLTAATFTLTNTDSGSAVATTVAYDAEESQAILTPDEPLAPATNYRATIAAEGVRSELDLRIEADVTWQFTTSARPVATLSPADGAADVALSVSPTVSFDRAMDAASVEGAISLADAGGTAVTSTVTFDADTNTATLVPTESLTPDTAYVLSVESTASSATGVPLSSAQTSEFTTIYYGPDDLALDVTYTGTLEMSAERPVYAFAYALPLSSDFQSNVALYSEALVDYPITGDGRYVIPASDISADRTEFLIVLVHDLNGSFSADQSTEDDADTHRWIKTDVAGNTVAQIEADPLERDSEGSLVLDENDNFIVKDEFIVTAGQEYVLEYYDESPADADAFEDDDDSGSYRTLTLGIDETARTFHTLTDEDYFVLTPDAYDYYDITIRAASLETRVTLFESESDMLTDQNELTASTGTAERIVNEGSGPLQSGTTYYVKVESPTGGLGSYEIGWALRPVPNEDPADPNEPNEDPNSPTPLSFGRDNALTAVIGTGLNDSSDQDVYEITVEDGQRFAIELTELDNHFASYLDKRNIDFGINLYTSWDGTNGTAFNSVDAEDFYEVSNGRIMYTASTAGEPETRWIQVSNQTALQGGSGPRPNAAYSIALTWGTDNLDKPYDEQSQSAWADDTADTDSSVYVSEVFTPGTEPYVRTIYSGDGGADPGDDIDWFKIRPNAAATELIVLVEPAAEDGILVDAELFLSEGDATVTPNIAAGPRGSAQFWNYGSLDSKSGFVFEPWTTNDPSGWSLGAERTFWLRVTRNTEIQNNPATGKYSVTVKAGADDEDDYYVESTNQSDITAGGYGVDDIPWNGNLGLVPGERNQLQWESTSSFADTEHVIGDQLDEQYWSIYKRDYTSLGQQDGVNNPQDDIDFFWMQFSNSGETNELNDIPISGDIRVTLLSNGRPGVPLKLTYWRLTETEWSDAQSDGATPGVVLESELGTADGTYTGTPSGQNYDISFNPTGIQEDEVFVFKIERDNAGAGADEPVSGEYRFVLRKD